MLSPMACEAQGTLFPIPFSPKKLNPAGDKHFRGPKNGQKTTQMMRIILLIFLLNGLPRTAKKKGAPP